LLFDATTERRLMRDPVAHLSSIKKMRCRCNSEAPDPSRAGDDGEVNFWLVDSPFTSLGRGSPLNREQFLLLTQSGGSMEAVKARGEK
jgi:hypothetical protein